MINETIPWIHWRNPQLLTPTIVQVVMLLCAVIIVLGLVYVIVLVLAIAIHHVLYDRDPKKVPDYVKHSVQFSSESENDGEPDENIVNEDSSSGSDGEHKQRNLYATTARKLAKLDKFLNVDN